jgi:hypothetical protein
MKTNVATKVYCMKLVSIQRHIISILLILAVCTTGIANAWDFADNHNPSILHIDHADPYAADMVDIKLKQFALAVITSLPYTFQSPEIVESFLTPAPVPAIPSQLYVIQLFPSRASPA